MTQFKKYIGHFPKGHKRWDIHPTGERELVVECECGEGFTFLGGEGESTDNAAATVQMMMATHAHEILGGRQ